MNTVSSILALGPEVLKPHTRIFCLSRNALFYRSEFDRIIREREDKADFMHIKRGEHLHRPTGTRWTYVAEPGDLVRYGSYVFGFLPTGHMHLMKAGFLKQINDDLMNQHCKAFVVSDSIQRAVRTKGKAP